MNSEQHSAFPNMRDFLELNEIAAEQCSLATDEFSRVSGEKLPASINGLGSVLSLLYRASCCAWGCREGDHQCEWFAARVVNQGMSAYRLIRAGYYDESLMLIRGIGEIANLLWLFNADVTNFDQWSSSSRDERMRKFSPNAVRTKLTNLGGIGSPIDDNRYRHLCEVGTHPVPGFAPGHYSGTGRPVLGGLLQPVGVYVCITELSYAVAMCAIPLSKLLGLQEEQAKDLVSKALSLIESLGAFTILNYNDLLTEAQKKTNRDGVPD